MFFKPKQHPPEYKAGQQPIVECTRCHKQTNGRHRCKRRSCKTYPFCWQHLMQQGLRVMPSTIPGIGNGLFAIKTFNRNDIVCLYTGDLLSDPQFDARYPDRHNPSQYVLQAKRGVNIDARSTASDVGRYANHATRNANVQFSLLPRTHEGYAEGFGCLKATKHIHGSKAHPVEIFVNYGPDYAFV